MDCKVQISEVVLTSIVQLIMVKSKTKNSHIALHNDVVFALSTVVLVARYN
jgi:hypothetical protein